MSIWKQYVCHLTCGTCTSLRTYVRMRESTQVSTFGFLHCIQITERRARPTHTHKKKKKERRRKRFLVSSRPAADAANLTRLKKPGRQGPIISLPVARPGSLVSCACLSPSLSVHVGRQQRASEQSVQVQRHRAVVSPREGQTRMMPLPPPRVP